MQADGLSNDNYFLNQEHIKVITLGDKQSAHAMCMHVIVT